MDEEKSTNDEEWADEIFRKEFASGDGREEEWNRFGACRGYRNAGEWREWAKGKALLAKMFPDPLL